MERGKKKKDLSNLENQGAQNAKAKKTMACQFRKRSTPITWPASGNRCIIVSKGVRTWDDENWLSSNMKRVPKIYDRSFWR